jgi:tetratricopeptide (TPR) repeat protein
MSVIARLEPRVIPTYPVGVPEKNPLFFEKRVYQGSNGKVYPVPFIDKVYDQTVDVSYQSALLENEHVRLVMLPEIGGRIFIGQDKTNQDYDFFYRQDVIKPALVGLAGPWISGGVEFNWPQHHRPGTFMPCDVIIEEEADGARTVWMSEHDPLNRLKGMHGVRLRPDSSLIELRVRLYNRTPLTHTFLWWANVAAMVHDHYQSIFPPDVHYVADHAVRATSSFPLALNHYYGVDYAARPGSNDLSWYKNIPVPTSYMVCQTACDFFGGYDHRAGGGFVHVADHRIAPGKKQWTWGDHAFGHAWDRELTDDNGPYIELMAGVFTDNQPDFSYLLPYETKTFSQFWWPIQGIGPVQQANKDAALRMVAGADRRLELGLNVTRPMRGMKLRVTENDHVLLEQTIDLAPGEAWVSKVAQMTGENPAALHGMLESADGALLLDYRPVDPTAQVRSREQAVEPPQPEAVASNDELYFIGEHLEQYRHPTRAPELYWDEALRRDSGDSRCQTALGKRALRAGRFEQAAGHFLPAIARLTILHPNPVTGEAHYFLGVTLALLGRSEAAANSLHKAAWSHEWRSAACYQLACLAGRAGDWDAALEHLDQSLATNRDHHQAAVLSAAFLRRLGRPGAAAILAQVIKIDPLDHWARAECAFGDAARFDEFYDLCRNDAQTIIDLALDYADAGLREEAIDLLEEHQRRAVTGVAVPNPLQRSQMTLYLLAWLKNDTEILDAARNQSPDYFFPSRLQEQIVLDWALAQPGKDPLAAYGLGNFLYDLKRHEDAISAWRRSLDDGALFATVPRNLGIAVWNARRDGAAARAFYQQALALDPADPRLVCEFDQLRAKLNDGLEERLAFLEEQRGLVLLRDDCTVAMAGLYNLLNQPQRALDLLTSRRFHPWEGGEGAVLRQFTTATILIGRQALAAGDAAGALDHFTGAMDTPENLGEAYHLLQAKADVNYWIGTALVALGRAAEARDSFERSAAECGDFAEMAVIPHSPLSYFRGLSLRALGREDEARLLFEDLRGFAVGKLMEKANIDYFATSLPDLLVFDEDLQARRDAENHLLLALAMHGLGDDLAARSELDRTYQFTNADLRAADLARDLAVIQPA